jgi:polygalacturonase
MDPGMNRIASTARMPAAAVVFAGIWLSVFARHCSFGQATLPSDFSVAAPQIPDRTFKLTDFGAVGDGMTLNTNAFQKAITACSDAGGGTLEVPAGRFLVGPFSLASNLNLHLDAGATILISDDRSDFKPTEDGYENCITAEDCHDLEVTGSGTIDGQGKSWWDEFLSYKHDKSKGVAPHRPWLIMLTNCTRVRFHGVTLANSPMLTFVPRLCRDVTIDSITIKSPPDSPNTDGIDPSGFNYLITHTTIDTGDDNIALKPRPIPDPDHLSCENLLIEHCTFLHGHGMSIGGGSNGGVRNMTVRDCWFEGTDSGIRLKSDRDRGGLVENLTYENLMMKRVKTSVMIVSYYPEIPKKPEQDPAQPIAPKTPIWRHIRISNLQSHESGTAVRIIGLAEMPVEDLTFTNVRITANKPGQIIHAKDVRFVDSEITATSADPMEIYESTVEGLPSVAKQ